MKRHDATGYGVLAIASILCSGSLGAQTVQEPAGHRLSNIGVGLNHHHDSLLCSRLNVGLRTEVDSLHGLQFGLFYGGIRRDAQGLMIAGIANAAHAMSGIQLAGFSNIVFTPMSVPGRCTVFNWVLTTMQTR